MTIKGNDRYATTAEIAERYRVKEETVRWWRAVGRGPAWFRVAGSRRVLYDLREVEAYDAQQRAASA